MLKQAGLAVLDALFFLLLFSKSLLKDGEWTDTGSTACSTSQPSSAEARYSDKK